MSHTPGPWIVEESNTKIGPRRFITTMVMVVAENGGMPGLIVNQGPVEPRDYANARLIAAAPDLLAALKEFVHGYQSGRLTEDERNQMARAAIAKAEGE